MTASHPFRTAAIVCGLLVVFGLLSFTAVLGKSATYDEPLHLIGGQVHRYLDDFRINPEDPALFGWWSTLPHGSDAMPLDKTDAHYEGAPLNMNEQWWFVVQTLYHRGAAVADSFLNTSRFMFVLIGMALGALIALWAYQLGGAPAAIAASVLFCFDPNMLAHSGLVKNDVPLSMFMCALGYCTWRLGRNRGGHITFLILAALACALALNVKFSAVLFFPMFGLMLLIRAVMTTPWMIWHFELSTRSKRVIFAIVGVAVALLFSFVVTWMVYDFRYSATATGEPLGTPAIVRRSVSNHLKIEIEEGRRPQMSPDDLEKAITQEIDAGHVALPVRVDIWMQTHHVLPEGWLFGFLYTYATTLIRSSFLMGTIRLRGWWYYFPAAMLFKTPTATLLSFVLAPLAAILSLGWLHASRSDLPPFWRRHGWTIVALTLPPGIYFVAALLTNLNLGLRHILPVYPFLFVGLGWIFSLLFRARVMLAKIVGGVIAGVLLLETVVAYPNFLPFFNAPSGGSRGGLKLLGDSNLDWGQDLTALVSWQHEHPADKIYLCYFGMADPRAYDLDFVNLPGGYPLLPMGDLSPTPGVVAISATNVQGIYIGSQLTHAYQTALKNEEPMEILNGTIYLYRWPPTPADRDPSSP